MAGSRIERPKKRNVTTVALTDLAAEKIDAYIKRRGGHGMKKHMLSNLLEWFADQPDVMKSVASKWIDAGMEAAYAQELRRLADELESAGGAISPEVMAGLRTRLKPGESLNDLLKPLTIGRNWQFTEEEPPEAEQQPQGGGQRPKRSGKQERERVHNH